ncbi:MAG: sugar transferase, partial [Patescibacteria group bacterium]
PDFYELLSGKIPVEAIGPDWFLENLKEGQKNYFNFLKRLIDIILALIILIISLPGWPLIALIIKLESRGPVFFRQIRLGLNEKEFRIFKFRSMKEDNNDRSLTQAKDTRITKFGNFLRKTRLDEVPQVINIIRNEMSFIGPRPERPEIVAELEKQIPYYKTRLLIKPGLTGWDQVSGEYHSATSEDTLEKLQYDLFYLKQRSLYLDLDITLRTIATMISRSGR